MYVVMCAWKQTDSCRPPLPSPPYCTLFGLVRSKVQRHPRQGVELEPHEFHRAAINASGIASAQKDLEKGSQPRFVNEILTRVEGLDHLWLDGVLLRGRASEQKGAVMGRVFREIKQKVGRTKARAVCMFVNYGSSAFRGRGIMENKLCTYFPRCSLRKRTEVSCPSAAKAHSREYTHMILNTVHNTYMVP